MPELLQYTQEGLLLFGISFEEGLSIAMTTCGFSIEMCLLAGCGSVHFLLRRLFFPGEWTIVMAGRVLGLLEFIWRRRRTEYGASSAWRGVSASRFAEPSVHLRHPFYSFLLSLVLYCTTPAMIQRRNFVYLYTFYLVFLFIYFT
jgi:hypothetical protein